MSEPIPEPGDIVVHCYGGLGELESPCIEVTSTHVVVNLCEVPGGVEPHRFPRGQGRVLNVIADEEDGDEGSCEVCGGEFDTYGGCKLCGHNALS